MVGVVGSQQELGVAHGVGVGSEGQSGGHEDDEDEAA